MTRDLDAARGQLQAVLERIQQTAQQAAVESSEAHEISAGHPARTPDLTARPSRPWRRPSRPRVFLGLCWSIFCISTDSTLHSGEEIRRLTGVPCLALIAASRQARAGTPRIHDYVVRRPLTAFAEQVRALRAGLSLDHDHPQIIAITAARPAEGKSLLTLALGRSAQLERRAGPGDRVRPAPGIFPRRLGGSRLPGLADVLRGERRMARGAAGRSDHRHEIHRGGSPGGDVLGLFLSDEIRRLLDEVRRRLST